MRVGKGLLWQAQGLTKKSGSGMNANPLPCIDYLFSPSSGMVAVLPHNDVRG